MCCSIRWDKEQLNKIIDLELAKVMRLLAERKVRIELTPAARERLVKDGYDPAYGARPLRRTVQRLVQDPLAMRILDGSVLPGDLVRVDIDPNSDSMRFERVEQTRRKSPRQNRARQNMPSPQRNPAGGGKFNFREARLKLTRPEEASRLN